MTKITTLTSEIQQKLNDCAEKAGIPSSQLLNILIDDEIERQRLLGIYQEISAKKDKKTNIPSQKIATQCNKYLSVLDHESENITIREAIENITSVRFV